MQTQARRRHEDAARARRRRYGATEKEAIYREDKLVVYRFKRREPPTAKVPILIVYALVNRPYMVDLQSDRSLVRNLLAQGEDVYLIDWGYPDRADRWLTLDDYINGYIERCVDAVARHTASSRSTCSASARAARSRCATRRCIRRRSGT